MKLSLILICGALTAIGLVFYFKIDSDPYAKSDRNLKGAPQYSSQGKASEASVYVTTGLSNLKDNDTQAAESAFKKALEIDPEYIQARVALASLYFAKGNHEWGVQELILATKADPENEALLHIVGTYGLGARWLTDYENLCRALLKKTPDSIAIKKKLTELLIVKGELQEARVYVGEIWKASPGDTDAIHFNGRIYLAEKNFVPALEILSQVTRQASRFAPAYYFLGLAWLGTNDIRQAKDEFIRAKELNPVWVEPRMALARIYLASGDYNLALVESEASLQVQPRNADILMTAGVARLKKGEIELALDLFRRAKELIPADANPHINIGAAYVVQKKYGQALTEYEEALRLGPDRIDALRSIAQVMATQGTQKAAFDRVEQQLLRTNNKAEVYQLLGQLSVNKQDYEMALSYLDKAVALNPDLISASFLIATTYMAQKRFDQAIDKAEKIIDKHPQEIPSYMLLGTLHDLKQQHDQANRYYRKVLELDNNHAPAANNLARNYTQYGGNLDLALTLAQKARELRPNDEGIADTLGWIYYKKRVYSMAIELLKESSDKFKDRNPTVLYHLGMAYSKSGNNELAKESFSKALKLNQNFREAQEAKQALEEIGAKTS